MATSPFLETPRLLIEPFTEERITARYVAWLNDKLVTRYSEHRFYKHTVETCRAYLHSFEGTPNFFWAIVVKANDVGHIGNMNAYLDTHNGVADMGILIGEAQAWGKGYATEAWLAACDFLFRALTIRKVTDGTIATNQPMLRLMARTGMVPDGCRVRQMDWEGQEVDLVHASIFRDEWLKRYPGGPFSGKLLGESSF